MISTVSPLVIKSSTYRPSQVSLISSWYWLSQVSRCCLVTPFSRKGKHVSPNRSLVQWKTKLLLLFGGLQWNRRESWSSSLILIWRKVFCKLPVSSTGWILDFIRMSNRRFWREGPGCRQSLRDGWLDFPVAEALYMMCTLVFSTFSLTTPRFLYCLWGCRLDGYIFTHFQNHVYWNLRCCILSSVLTPLRWLYLVRRLD